MFLLCGNEMFSCTGMETEVQSIHIQQTHIMSLHGLRVLDSSQQYVYSL